MPPREWRHRIDDIQEAAARIARYVEGISLANFEADDRTIDAVCRCFGIIGEAATHIPDEIAAAHLEVPWHEMRGMRSIVVHEYFWESRTKPSGRRPARTFQPSSSLCADF